MISLNKQDFNLIRSQVWHWREHQAGLLCCVWDQNDRFAVTENKRAPQQCGKLSQHTKLFSRQNGKSCRPRTAWADVGTSAAQTAPVCFWFHHSAASQRANKLLQSNSEWRFGCEPRLRCRPHFSSSQAPRGNDFCHLTLSHTLFNHSSSTTSVFPLISRSFVRLGLIQHTPVDSRLPPHSPI